MRWIVFLLLLISASADEARTWFLTKGTSFQATYAGFKGGKVGLKNEAGKVVAIPIDDLSVVDLYYLHDEQEISLEDLEGGNVAEAENLYEVGSSQLKAVDKLKLKGEGYNLSLSALATPHFLLIHSGDLKVDKIAEMLERIWYSHAFRTPGFIEEFGEKKRVYFYLPPGEELAELGKYYAESMEGKVSARDLAGMLQEWDHKAPKAEIFLPEAYAEKYNATPSGYVQRNESKMEYLEAQENSTAFYKWQELFFPAQELPQNKSSSKKKEVKGLCALVFANEIRLHGNEALTDTGVYSYSLSYKFPPQGKPRSWGKLLVESVKEEVVKPSLAFLYDDDIFGQEKGDASNLAHTQMLMAFGRFLEKDLAHMIYRCRLSDYFKKEEKFPSHSELAKMYGFSSSVAMDDAFEEFLLKENTKL